MVEEYDLSIITGLEGYDSIYSLYEFTEYLKADLSSEKSKYGRVFWRAERYQQSEYELYHDFNSSSTFYQTEIKEKIRNALKEWVIGNYLVQFWAPIVDGRHLYLTTSDQPFSVGPLCKGLCWYRKLCMDQYCVNVEQLGAVGRVYPESSPDLRLYTTNEFPLRDYAARCGIRRYLVAKLRSTHSHLVMTGNQCLPNISSNDSEISKMLELAVKAVPQLHLAQVWVPCKQCANMSNNLSCMDRATFINAEDEIVNACQNIFRDKLDYIRACKFHNLQIEKGIARALMSSNSKSCFCRNICDISISENPLAHYAQKARLSLCFAISLESVHNSNDIYVIEFFLQSNCREDASGDSFLHLLLRIMEMELKSYKFALRGQLVNELIVELSQLNVIEYESIEYTQEMNHQHSEQLNMFMLMERYWESYSESDFQKYLQTAELCCLRPSENENDEHGWVFCSPAREELSENDVTSNSSLVANPIKGKIKCLMKEIASDMFRQYGLVQFWAPKMEEGRSYLETSDQPYVLGCLGKGLALFRKQCMRHHYFVDEGAKEEEVGPPGRVFRNGHPELTRDLRLCSTTEFSLRNHAAHCCLRSYFALPVLDLHQQKCVGVLEFVGFSDSIFDVTRQQLEAANLSLTHFNLKPDPSFLATHVPSNIAECRKLALTEVEEALKLVSKIPQMFKAEVLVPYGECASINSNPSCMELALSTDSGWEFYLPTSEIHVPITSRKGIAGMVLASENKACFCRNSCDFSFTEQHLAHYAQQDRLDVCFAICLQSSHTGSLLYVLEFFLNQGPATFEYLRSFLNFLLPIMRQNLKSFKVASGKQLGEELVVEVIEFSEANKLTLSELDQPDICPLKFKTVQYRQKEHRHTKDQQLQYVFDDMDSVRSVAADNSKKEDATTKTERGKRKNGLHLNLEDLESHFGKRLIDVAKELGVGRSTIKRACRYYGIHRWPCNEKYKKNPSLFETESANEISPDSQQNMRQSSRGNLLTSDLPFQQNVPQTNTENIEHLTVHPEAEKVIIKVIIKAKYEDDTIKFQLCLSSGMDKLVEEVATRLNLKMGSFKLIYMDEDNDEILLTCDADLQLCLKSLIAVGKICIQLFVQLIRK